MKNKKGFTLVELLAVIVILGVLLLVAVPAVQNTIQKSRRKAFVDGTASIVKAVTSDLSLLELEGKLSWTAVTGGGETCNYNFESADLQSGGVDGSGYIKVNKSSAGVISYEVYATNGSYAFSGKNPNQITEDNLASTAPSKDTYSPTSYSTTCKS